MARLVAVTGGGGYVATELIHQLLAKGYSVRATVRDARDAAKVGHLARLAAALPGNLQLVEADLLAGTTTGAAGGAADSEPDPKAGSGSDPEAGPTAFDVAFEGCSVVFHCASPFFIDAADPQAELVDPAVRGTRAVLAAAARQGVRRVVLTSSCAAIKGMKDPAPPKVGATYSEADWNETSTVEGGEAYWVSKTQAERGAWEAAARLGLDLVTILPEFIMGPLIGGRADGTSVGYMKAWVEGRAQAGAPVFADVRDVARAHVLAAENLAASGRYIVAASHTTPAAHISAWLQERYPEHEFEAGEAGEPAEAVDNRRAREGLGLALTPVRETLLDMAATLIALGLAQPKPRQRAG